MANIYERTLNNSIKNEKSRKQTFKKGEVKGLKDGILINGIATLVVTGLENMGYKSLTFKPLNSSYTAGFESVIKNSHKVKGESSKHWIDYNGVVSDYDADTMDLDSFVYGAYCSFSIDTKITDMEGLFRSLYMNHYSLYSSFTEYCDSKRLTIEKDGELVIDTTKYIKTINNYMNNYNENIQERVKRGM